jgi:hypothetical protein
MKAINGGSTTWTRNIIHWVLQPALCPKALVVHTSTAEAKGSIAVNSAKASPTGIRRTAKIGKIKADPAPLTLNQYGASASHPPITEPAAIDIIETKVNSRFSLLCAISLVSSQEKHK